MLKNQEYLINLNFYIFGQEPGQVDFVIDLKNELNLFYPRRFENGQDNNQKVNCYNISN